MFRSYIIFSERCELKKMFVNSPEVLSILEINQIHSELSKYALADAATKQVHIDAMKWRN